MSESRDFNSMGFDDINNHAHMKGFTINEEIRLRNLGIIEIKGRKHLCEYCKRQNECRIGAWFIDGNDTFGVTECRFYEEASP